jgi:anthranilate phosphoribosyltransferase
MCWRPWVSSWTPPEIVEEAVQTVGIGFLFAPLYHSAMKHAAKPRQELGVRSIFNMLGPLTNPASANCQLLGVFAPQLTEMFAQALKLLGDPIGHGGARPRRIGRNQRLRPHARQRTEGRGHPHL